MNRKPIFEPDYAVHPGKTIKETLRAKHISQLHVAHSIGCSISSMNRMLNGHQRIRSELIAYLVWKTGVPTSFWENLQAQYDAAIKRGAKAK